MDDQGREKQPQKQGQEGAASSSEGNSHEKRRREETKAKVIGRDRLGRNLKEEEMIKPKYEKKLQNKISIPFSFTSTILIFAKFSL